MSQDMNCAYCGKLKKWPDNFPVSHYARCDECYKKNEEKAESEAQKKLWRLFRLFGIVRGKS